MLRKVSPVQGYVAALFAIASIAAEGIQDVDCDEESQRELWSASIHAASIKSVHAIEMVRQELALLKMKSQQYGNDEQEEQQQKSGMHRHASVSYLDGCT